MIKKYICSFRTASFRINGKSIRFADRCINRGGSIHITNNKEIQDLIESTNEFKKGVIRIEEVIEETPIEKTPVKVYDTIIGVQNAIEVIKQECKLQGVEYTTIRSKEKVLKKSKELGISFPNIG